MYSPSLIGVTGPARSGKDTVTHFLIAAYGGYRYGFADPIRAMLLGIGINMNDPYWESRKEDVIPALGVSPRYMMQTLGTEWGRRLVNQDIWLILGYNKLLKDGPGMVVSDVRFENEAKWIRERGGTIIHVFRPGIEPVAAHSSENGVDFKEGDIRIVNDGTLEELQNSIRELFNGGYKT